MFHYAGALFINLFACLSDCCKFYMYTILLAKCMLYWLNEIIVMLYLATIHIKAVIYARTLICGTAQRQLDIRTRVNSKKCAG